MPERPLLREIKPAEIGRSARPAVDPGALADAMRIVEAVRTGGRGAVESFAREFGERGEGDPLFLDRPDMHAVLEGIDPDDRGVLERAAARIEAFAVAQREAIRPVTVPIPGGEAGHTVEPVESAGCYAPGGRYPLPSSALMTAIPARVAGCERVVVASPGANRYTVAAAAIAGADGFLAVGGAHAMGALAYGFEGFRAVDFIAGPGNRWVTAAKHLLSGVVGIDMLAGPSELLIIADDTAEAGIVASDLLAQAEHDVDAVPVLLTTSRSLAARVEDELWRQLGELGTAETARRALGNGFFCVVEDVTGCVRLADRLAPEHLEVMTRDAAGVAAGVRHAGALFIGAGTAEVIGDYGAGPNHTLPTGGTARFQAGLSVASFLRLRTWIRMESAAPALLADTRRLAEIEGLEGHARSAAARVV